MKIWQFIVIESKVHGEDLMTTVSRQTVIPANIYLLTKETVKKGTKNVSS